MGTVVKAVFLDTASPTAAAAAGDRHCTTMCYKTCLFYTMYNEIYLKALSSKINEDHESQFSLFLVYILTLKYKEHLPIKGAQSVHFTKTWHVHILLEKSNQKQL